MVMKDETSNYLNCCHQVQSGFSDYLAGWMDYLIYFPTGKAH